MNKEDLMTILIKNLRIKSNHNAEYERHLQSYKAKNKKKIDFILSP